MDCEIIILVDRDISDSEMTHELLNALHQKKCELKIFQTGRTNQETELCSKMPKNSYLLSYEKSAICLTPPASLMAIVEMRERFKRLGNKLSKLPDLASRYIFEDFPTQITCENIFTKFCH